MSIWLCSACARSRGAHLQVDVLGAVEEVTPGADGFPEVVEIEAQGTRFVRDAGARVPSVAPALEVRVSGPREGGAQVWALDLAGGGARGRALAAAYTWPATARMLASEYHRLTDFCATHVA